MKLNGNLETGQFGGYVDIAMTSKVFVDSPYTALLTNEVISYNATNGASIVNLPTAVGNIGKKYIIIKTDVSANSVTLDAYGSETIGGALTFVLYSQNAFVSVISDGTNWIITNRWFAPAYLEAYRVSSLSPATPGTWEDVPLTSDVNKKNIIHTVANWAYLYPVYSGVYKIRYHIIIRHNGATDDGYQTAARLATSTGGPATEIPGSLAVTYIDAFGNINHDLSGSAIVFLDVSTGVFVTLNFVAPSANILLALGGGIPAIPIGSVACVTMEKIDE